MTISAEGMQPPVDIHTHYRPVQICRVCLQRPVWAGLAWAVLGWTGLGWAGLGLAGVGWAGLGWACLGWAMLAHDFAETLTKRI